VTSAGRRRSLCGFGAETNWLSTTSVGTVLVSFNLYMVPRYCLVKCKRWQGDYSTL
jgi:hypothetical protein